MTSQFLLAAALAALLGAAWSDVRAFRISNLFPLALIVLFIPFAVLGEMIASPWWHLSHFGIALAAGMLLFGLKWIGGGDAKLYAAIALWFPLSQAPFLLVAITLAGGGVALIYIVMRRFGIGPNAKLDRKDRRIPYGVALAAGAVVCWLLQPAAEVQPSSFEELSTRALDKK